MERSTIGRGIALAGLLMALAAGPALAQEEYGIGESKIVPVVPSGNITLDGTLGEAEYWSTGATFDLLAASAFSEEGYPADIEEATAFVLYSEDTLWVAVSITETEIFAAPEESIWQSDQILIGIDPVHTPGETDALEATGEEGYHGWPENAPDQGPYAYKIYPDGEGGAITLNWGFNEIDPVSEGWARGVVWTDVETNSWGIEAAFYVPTVEEGTEIGFNIGGAQASEAACGDVGECTYGFFSQWSVEEPGGDVMSRTASYGTLQMAGGGEGYGSGVTVEVPRVEPGTIVIDGVADEAAWENAQSDIDVVANWNSYGVVGDPLVGSPDIYGDTKLLWSDDTLYVYHHLYDVELFWGLEGDFWGSDQILLGIDNSFAGDSIAGFDPNFGGGAEFAPEGTYTYFINAPAGFTFAWNPDITPADSGWVNGEVFVNEETFEWGIEAAFYVPSIENGANIGFDIGGAQASANQCEEGYCDYAYFAWQTGTGGTDPGAINRNASQWAALTMVETLGTSIEERPTDEIPQGFQLSQNYPNPFNPSTNIDYSLERAARVTLTAYNVLGQKVATLVDGMRAAGTYHVRWEAGDLPSGTYLYRLQVDGATVATRAMLLVK